MVEAQERCRWCAECPGGLGWVLQESPAGYKRKAAEEEEPGREGAQSCLRSWERPQVYAEFLLEMVLTWSVAALAEYVV